MPVQPESAGGVPNLQRDTNQQSGNGSPVRAKGPRYESGRFSLLLIDNETKKAARVNVQPLRLDMMLQSNRRDRPLLIGYLLAQILEAARKLYPEFSPEPVERPPIKSYPVLPRTVEGPSVPFLPRWRRRRFGTEDDYEDDGGV